MKMSNSKQIENDIEATTIPSTYADTGELGSLLLLCSGMPLTQIISFWLGLGE